MRHRLTPATERAVNAAARWQFDDSLQPPAAPQRSAIRLLAGLLSEPECRAALVLSEYGVGCDELIAHWPSLRQSPVEQPAADELRHAVAHLLAVADAACIGLPGEVELATEHLLLGLLSEPGDVAEWLKAQELSAADLQARMERFYGVSREPLPYEADVAAAVEDVEQDVAADRRQGERGADRSRCDRRIANDHEPSELGDELFDDERLDRLNDGAETAGVYRVLDAAANRAREGLRVAEDFTRFVLGDRFLMSRLKAARHALADLLGQLPADALLAARDTIGDVGTNVSTRQEGERGDARQVAAANLKRVQEALRTLEEFGKLLDAGWAAGMEQLRYRCYTDERAILNTHDQARRLANVRLYALLDGRGSEDEFGWLATELLYGGVDAIQLRDKQLSDRELIARGHLLRQLTAECGALYIMNDRADLAVLTNADGVHVGQSELAVCEARRIVGSKLLIGVSTHSLGEAQQAVLDGASYIGVGPTFPSRTKQFAHFTGLELLAQVAREVQLPALAIGGIDRANLAEVLATGIRRVAVGAELTQAADPRSAAAELRQQLVARE